MKRILLILFLLSSFYAFPQGGSIPRSELVTASGTDTYAATISSIASLANGLTVKVKFTNANTGASTFTLTGSSGSLGSVSLRKHDGTALSAGDITATGWYWLVYDLSATQWRLSGGGGAALTDGNGTTANGSAVDLGGTVTGSVAITTSGAGSESLVITAVGDEDVIGITGNHGSGEASIYVQNGGSGNPNASAAFIGSDGLNMVFDEDDALGAGTGITITGASPKLSTDYSGTYTARSLTDKGYVDAFANAKVANTITNGVTTIAPAQDAVFDALALKAPLASPTFTGTVTVPTPVGVTDAVTKGYVDDLSITLPITVPNGGIGLSSLNPYSILAGGTTSTNNIQQISGVGSSGQSLVSNGAGALPTWQDYYWKILGTTTLTGVTTVTSNAASQHLFNGTWTASANNDAHIKITPSLTTRNTASDRLYGLIIAPTLTNNAGSPATTTMAALYINPSFAGSGLFNTMGIQSEAAYAGPYQNAFRNLDTGASSGVSLALGNNSAATIGVVNVGSSANTTFGTAGSFNISAVGASANLVLGTNTAARVTINPSGRTFFGGSTSATALIHIAAGTATASTAPIKFSSGTPLTTPEAGVLELSTLEPLYSTSTTAASRGYFNLGRITTTATGLTLDANHSTLLLSATGQTATLPTAVGRLGRVYTVKLTASGSGTVATTSSQTIDGSTTYSLSAQYKYVTVQSDNANWHIIANN